MWPTWCTSSPPPRRTSPARSSAWTAGDRLPETCLSSSFGELMSWEGYRLTSKAPAEVYAVLGPHGVDELLHHARNAIWREYPEADRSFAAVRQRVREVFDRNIKVWRAIKKPSPQAFFENLLPHAADGHIRQALVTCWM